MGDVLSTFRRTFDAQPTSQHEQYNNLILHDDSNWIDILPAHALQNVFSFLPLELEAFIAVKCVCKLWNMVILQELKRRPSFLWAHFPSPNDNYPGSFYVWKCNNKRPPLTQDQLSALSEQEQEDLYFEFTTYKELSFSLLSSLPPTLLPHSNQPLESEEKQLKDVKIGTVMAQMKGHDFAIQLSPSVLKKYQQWEIMGFSFKPEDFDYNNGVMMLTLLMLLSKQIIVHCTSHIGGHPFVSKKNFKLDIYFTLPSHSIQSFLPSHNILDQTSNNNRNIVCFSMKEDAFLGQY